MKTKEELKQIIETAKEFGMSKVEVDGVIFTIPELSAVTNNVPEAKPEEIVNPLSILDEMSEDEITYWASPYYDELMARKEQSLNKEEE